MAYCCAAALRDGEMSALSRSTPQYSQPTFDSSAEAWLQSCTQEPLRHAYPSATSHACVACHDCPCASHVTTDCCWQLVTAGLHVPHTSSDEMQIWPMAWQSVVVCHEAG